MQTESHSPGPLQADPAWRIGIVHSSFYTDEMLSMVRTAKDTLIAAGIPEKNIFVQKAAGSWEVPLIGAALVEAKKVDGLIGLGIIVKGQTHHDELLAREAARGMMDVQMRYALPFSFEILHTDTLDLARKRAMGLGNKGEEAAYAVLHSLRELKTIRSGKH